MNYNPSYPLQPSPAPSEPSTRSTPSPPPSESSFQYLPLLPFNNNHHPSNNHLQRQVYPTSSPYQHQQHSAPDPSPSLSKIRLPPPTPTSYFTNGYASPAASSYSSSEPGSRDEIDLMEPGTLGGSSFHGGQHPPGIDGMIFRGDGMQLEKHSPRSDSRDRDRHHRKRWNMRDFNLVQTVGMSSPNRYKLTN